MSTPPLVLRCALLILAVVALSLPAASARGASAPPPTLPAPSYMSVSKEMLIPMDDGVRIAATVAYPSRDGKSPAPGRFPVVLATTPYGRNGVGGATPPTIFATRGMIGVVADVRGTGGSEGTLAGNYFSPREARDGAALVEYFGTQSYSSGKVGMTGASYVGITQYLAAERQPRHLAAITPTVAISDLYRDGFAHGGIPSLSFDLQYIGVQGAPGALGVNTDPSLLQETLKAKLGQGVPGSIAFDYLRRPDDDQFYRDRSPIYHADKIKVPVLVLGGWNDGLLRGATEMYTALARRRGVETRLSMNPCTHKGCGAPFAPLTDPPGQPDALALTFEFLSKYLVGAKTPARPPVEFYLQGKNINVSAARWPPASTTFRRFDLGPGSLHRAGGMPAAPGATTGRYFTNPLAGFSMAFDKYGTVAATPYIPTDQRLEGPQGVTFRTPLLTAPLDLVGPIALHLVAASTAKDTDWYAKVADVALDGSESIITEGALRASHRELDRAKSTPQRPYHTHIDPQPIQPNRFYAYDVEIWPTAYELARGHRLQLRLTSTDLPTHLPGSYFADLARPQDTRVDLLPAATNTVRFQGSYLLLPVSDAQPAAVPAGGCQAPTRARRATVRRGRLTDVSAQLSRDGRRVRGATIRLRGPGFRRQARTDSRGRVTFRVRPRRSGRATISTALCRGTLRVSARQAARG